MIVDCDRCAARGHGCADCVISVLLGPPDQLDLDEDERRALNLLADAGIVPHLQLHPLPLPEVLPEVRSDPRRGRHAS